MVTVLRQSRRCRRTSAELVKAYRTEKVWLRIEA